MISIREVFRHSSKLSAANVVGAGIATVVNIVVARRLGPEALGAVGLVQLWLLYVGFARPGILNAGYREVLHLTGQGRAEDASCVERVALTGETLALTAPLIILGAGAAFWYRDPTLRIGLAIGTGVFLANSLFQFADTVQWGRQRFAFATRVNVLMKILQPLCTLAGLYAFGLFGVLAAPGVASGAGLWYYCTRGESPLPRPLWDKREAVRLLAIGFPIALYGFLYWGFRTSDRALTAAFLSIAELGYFTFSMTFINQGCQWISDFLNVLQASLFAELGRFNGVRPLAPKLERVALLLLLVACAASGAAQAAFSPLVRAFVPKFIPGIGAFDILSLNLVCITAPLLANTILISSVVNRQKTCALIQTGGLVVNVLAGGWAVSRGAGLSGIAWASVLAQLLTACASYATLHPHLFGGAPRGESLRFYGWSGGLLAGAFCVHLTLGNSFFSPGSGQWAALGYRLLAVSLIWGAAGFLLHRSWWPATEVR